MSWVLVIGAAWLVVAVVTALLIAGVIGLADKSARRSIAAAAATNRPNVVVDPPTATVPETAADDSDSDTRAADRRDVAWAGARHGSPTVPLEARPPAAGRERPAS
jgi:hypothetical protein